MTRLLIVLLVCATSAWALEQEETYTDLVPGTGMLDPAHLAKLLQQNDVRAMNNVALLWARGYQGKQSYDEAMKWWKEAARRGYTVAMNNIGLMYFHGHGAEKDLRQALDWWHQSAFLGNAWAMNNVGDLYENGLGVAQDLAMAVTWYKSGAEQGERMAMYNLGLVYENGRGVDRDDAQAHQWYRQASEKGYAPAIFRVGLMHRDGRAVAADPVEALAWLLVAANRFPPEDAEEAAENRRSLNQLDAELGAERGTQARVRAVTLESELRAANPGKEQPLKPGENNT
ncbi:MAG: tetratricopeptide repeat protein [Burkholderiales bacterium]